MKSVRDSQQVATENDESLIALPKPIEKPDKTDQSVSERSGKLKVPTGMQKLKSSEKSPASKPIGPIKTNKRSDESALKAKCGCSCTLF